MNVNRMRGKPYQSRLLKWIPQAVALRRSGWTWARTAARLSEIIGEPVPLTTLYEAATRWVKRQASLEALPDPAAEFPPPGRPRGAKAPPVRKRAPASPGQATSPLSLSEPTGDPLLPWDADAGDEDGPPPGPVIRINRHAKPTPS